MSARLLMTGTSPGGAGRTRAIRDAIRADARYRRIRISGSDCAPTVFALPVHVGQDLMAPHSGHHRLLILNESRPARYPSNMANSVTSTSTATLLRSLLLTN